MIEDLILLIFLLILSGFFSGSEMAYIVANKLKIEIKARKKNPAAINANHLIAHPQTFFSTILIGNNIVNVTLSSLSAIFLSYLFGFGEGSILIISTAFLLIIGEFLPKYFAHESAERILLLTAIPVRFFSYLLYPVVKATSLFTNKLTQSAKLTADIEGHLFDKEDIKQLLKESEEAGVVDKKESGIISKVIELGEQRVYEAMTPRTDIVGVEISDNIESVLSVFIKSGFSKLPVYEENLDNIKGIILAKDIFKNPETLKSIMREVSYIPETKKSFAMLNEFLDKKISISIVIDEFGGTAGIVTMEDILEELFGEIKDEFDVDEVMCRRIALNTFIISGRAEIDYINEKYNLNIMEGDYETMAGFITTRLGKIPNQGDTVNIDNFSIFIVRSSLQKIDVVKLIKIRE